MQTLEAQVRECFGRVVWSHKAHEKSADMYFRRHRRIKFWTVVLAAITTTDLVAAVIGKNEVETGIGTVLSFIVLGLTLYMEQTDFGSISNSHKDTADKLWEIREGYFSLLTDIRSGKIDESLVRDRRDQLQQLTSSINSLAPRTLDKAQTFATKALKLSGGLTFTPFEIDNFLPKELRSVE